MSPATVLSGTFAHWLHNSQKTKAELEVYSSLYGVYNTQEPSFSG